MKRTRRAFEISSAGEGLNYIVYAYMVFWKTHLNGVNELSLVAQAAPKLKVL